MERERVGFDDLDNFVLDPYANLNELEVEHLMQGQPDNAVELDDDGYEDNFDDLDRQNDEHLRIRLREDLRQGAAEVLAREGIRINLWDDVEDDDEVMEEVVSEDEIEVDFNEEEEEEENNFWDDEHTKNTFAHTVSNRL